MSESKWFEDYPVIGKMAPAEAVGYFRDINEPEVADALEEASATERQPQTFGVLGDLWPFGNKPYLNTAHAFGYLAPAPAGQEALPIQYAGNIEPDVSLKNGRIKITLDRLRVADYPGGSTHHVLFDFYAQNQVPGDVEQLHFNTTYRVREGQQAATIGYPIFVGLNVGSEGVAFKCFTVNVKNDADEAFLGFLESDVFKAGLRLASTAQPAIAPLSTMAMGITKSILSHNKNKPVQDFYMGLDFTRIPTRARLKEGSYIAVQIPETLTVVWNWDEWVYNPVNGSLVNAADMTKLIPYNYVVFGVSRFDGA